MSIGGGNISGSQSALGGIGTTNVALGQELTSRGIAAQAPQGMTGANLAAYNVDPMLMGIQNELYQMYSQGKLFPAQAKAIQLAQQQADQSIQTEMASMGLTNSTMAAELMGNVDLQAATQTSSLLNQNLALGMQAEGMNMQSLQQQLQYSGQMISAGLSAYGISSNAFSSQGQIALENQKQMLGVMETAMQSAGEMASMVP